jgi:hypothetical protein
MPNETVYSYESLIQYYSPNLKIQKEKKSNFIKLF